MKNTESKISRFKALLRAGWYKLSSVCYNAEFGAFLSHSVAIVAALSILIGCGTTKYIPVDTKTETIINYVDSTRWIVKDSTIIIPIERYKEYEGWLDTLVIDGSLSVSKAWNDTSYHKIVGTLENKAENTLKTRIEYRDRVVVKTDSIYIEKPIPIEVEKVVKKNPKLLWWSLGINILVVLLVALRIYLKFQIGK